MYLAVNTTKRVVTLSDLKITLVGNQMIDLDLYKKTNINPEDSVDLNKAVRAGIIKIMQTDRKKQAREQKPKEKEKNNSEEIKKIMREIIKDELKDFKDLKKDNTKDSSNESVELILKEIKKLNTYNKNINNENNDDLLDAVDEDKLVEIHAKALNKLESHKGNVKYNEDVIDDSSFDNNLEDLDQYI